MAADVTVIVCTYNSDLKSTLVTLNSVIKQRNVRTQIIIADDGSQNNNFAACGEFLKGGAKLIGSKENMGTVKNILRAIPEADGKYIKLISPGDYLYSPDVLSDWLGYMEESGCKNSFGNAVYYSNSPEFRIFSGLSAPRDRKAFESDDWDAVKFHYVVMGDTILGASFLTEKDELYRYLSRIENHVRLCEDFSYMLMALDNRRISHYDSTVVWYEYGTGVSTGDGARKRVYRDWINFHKALVRMEPTDKFMSKYQAYARLMLKSDSALYRKILKTVFYPSCVRARMEMARLRPPENAGVDMSFYRAITEGIE